MAGTNLFDLAAKISVDAKGVDSTLTSTQQKVLNLAGQFKHLDTATTTSKTALAQIATEATGATSSLGSLTAIFPAAAAGAVLFTASLGALIGFLVKSASAYGDYGEKVHDTQLKMDISGESMARLSVIAKETNTDIDTLARTSNRLQVGISRGLSEPSSEAGRALKLLNLDIKALSQESPDAQLQKVSRGLLSISSSSDRARASTALAGRGFAELKPALSDIAEKWEEAGRKANAFGLVLTQSQIDAADEYKDTLADIELATQGFVVQVGSKFVPQLLGLLNDIGGGLDENESAWVTWAQRVGDVIEHGVIGARVLLVGLKASIAGVTELLSTANLGSAIGKYFVTGAAAQRALAADVNLRRATSDVVDVTSAARRGVPSTAGTGFPGTEKGAKGGDPAATAQRLAELRLAAILAGLKAEDEATKRSLTKRVSDFEVFAAETMETERKRHAAIIKGLMEENIAANNLRDPLAQQIQLQSLLNKHAEEEARHKEVSLKLDDQRISVANRIADFQKTQIRSIQNLTAQTSQWDTAVQTLIDSLEQEGFQLNPVTKAQFQHNAAMAKELELTLSITRARIVAESVRERAVSKGVLNRPPWIDLGGGSTVGGEVATSTRPRIATAGEAVMREKLAKFHDQMRTLAEGLTGAIDSALKKGFESGVKAGLATFAQGILSMINSILLEQLRKKLESVLSSVLGGSSGSGGGVIGWLQKILGVAGPALAGSAGGVPAGAAGKAFNNVIPGIHFASGGIVPGIDRGYDSVPAMLRPGERVLTKEQQRATGPVTLVVNYHAAPGENPASRATIYQLGKQIHGVVAKSQLIG